jgi:aminoglycoside phosphotransferase (APT) family kinase protein
VGVHPDFQPDNVLVSAHGVTVLDFTSFQYGSPYSDASRFLATLAFFRRNPLYGRAIYALMTAFWEGYDRGDATHPALALYMVRHMIRNTLAAAAWRHPFLLNHLLRRRAVTFLARWEQRLEASQRALAAASPRGGSAHTGQRGPG